MATATENKYKKLNQPLSQTSEQLMYPLDLVSDSSYSPFVAVFEVNTIRGHKAPYTHKLSKNSNKIPGAYGNEVEINRANGSGKGSYRWRVEQSNPIYTKSGESVVLPMHNVINTSYITNWSQVELGTIGRTLDLMNAIKNASDTDAGLVDKVASMGNIALQQTKEGAISGAANALKKIGFDGAGAAIEIARGVTVNSYSETMFKGVSNRVHMFSYTFVPRNLKEAQMVRAIIHRFKYHMMPEYKTETAGNSYILHPSTFDISFIDIRTGKINGWVHQIATCALTNCSVNGTPNGEYAVTKDGAFTAVTVDLQFMELITMCKEDMQDVTESF